MVDARPVLPVKTHCPSCGVAVVVGAERCDRCHALLPRYPGASGRRWLPVLLLVIAAGAAIWWFARARGGGEATPEAAAPAGTAAPAGAGQAPADDITREAALGGLTSSMQYRNLQGTVKVRAAAPDVVDIVADRCGDRIRGLIATHADALRRTGMTAARCLAADGTVAFEVPF